MTPNYPQRFAWLFLLALMLTACSRLKQSNEPKSGPVQGPEIPGGWSGTGGDKATDQNNPWFLETALGRPIRYCIAVDANYPYGKQVSHLENFVGQSLAEWVQFLDKHGIKDLWLGDKYAWLLDKTPRRLALSFIKVECDESEVDLRLLFGVKDKLVSDYLASVAVPPISVALRGPYNHTTYWNPGTLWFAEKTSEGVDWIGEDSFTLKHMILHELGHVFGMKHNSVFVMDERAADLITEGWYNDRMRAVYGKIEHDGWPFNIREGSLVDFTAGNIIDEKVNKSRGTGFAFPGFMAAGLKSVLGFTKSFKLAVGFEKLPSSESPDSKLNFLFTELENRSEPKNLKVKIFNGTDFKASSRSDEAPGFWMANDYLLPSLYTFWKHTEAGATHSYAKKLGSAWTLPLCGSVEIEGVRFGVFIGQAHRGLTIQLVDSRNGEWTNLVSPAFLYQMGPK